MWILILSKKYNPLFDSDARYFIITGGRGSGKSYAATVFLTLLTMTKGIRILFTRYTMTSARLSIIPEFLEKIGLLGYDEVFSVNKAEVVNLKNKSDILFRGIKTSAGNQTASLKSLTGVSTWVLDEAEEQKLIENLTPMNSMALKSLEIGLEKKEQWAVKLFFEYFYGRPQQRVDVTSNEESLNMPLITFIETDTE